MVFYALINTTNSNKESHLFPVRYLPNLLEGEEERLLGVLATEELPTARAPWTRDWVSLLLGLVQPWARPRCPLKALWTGISEQTPKDSKRWTGGSFKPNFRI